MYSYCGNDPINYVDPNGLFFGKLFGWIGKAFKFIGKVLLAVGAVLLVAAVLHIPGAGAAFSWLFSANGFLAKVLGYVIKGTSFIIKNLAALVGVSAEVGTRGALLFWGVFAGVGAVSSLLSQKEIRRTHHDPCLTRDITVPPGVSVDQNIKIAQEKVHRIHVLMGMAGDQGGTAGPLASALWFREQVRNAKGRVNDVRSGKSWDYKQLGGQYEDLGNFNYGATGASTGLFDDKTLQQKAGEAQIDAGTSKPEWQRPPYYGNDPEDTEMIQRGIDYFKAGCHKRNK